MMIPTPMAQPYSPTSGLRSRADSRPRGDPGGDRTRGLRIKSPLLYQLSYRVGRPKLRCSSPESLRLRDERRMGGDAAPLPRPLHPGIGPAHAAHVRPALVPPLLHRATHDDGRGAIHVHLHVLVHRRRDRVRRIFQRGHQLRLVVQLAATIGGNEILGEQPAEWCRIPPHHRSSPLVLQAAQRLLHAALGKTGRRGGEQEGRHQLKLSHPHLPSALSTSRPRYVRRAPTLFSTCTPPPQSALLRHINARRIGPSSSNSSLTTSTPIASCSPATAAWCTRSPTRCWSTPSAPRPR